MKIRIRNLSGQSLGIMLEPETNTLELATGKEAEVIIEGQPDQVTMDVNSDNFV